MGFVTKLLINSPANKREMGTPDSRNLISVISWLFQTRKYGELLTRHRNELERITSLIYFKNYRQIPQTR